MSGISSPVNGNGGSSSNPRLAFYQSDAGQAIGTASFTVIDFEDQVSDSDGLVTTGASWNYEAPEDGTYEVVVGLVWDSVDWATGNSLILDAYVDGSAVARIDFISIPSDAGSVQYKMSGVAPIQMLTGEELDVRIFQNSGADRNLQSNAARVWISIKKIG